MNTTQFITGNKAASLSAIPSMEADLLMPDLDELDTISDDENANIEESYDMADFTLYM